MAKHDMSRLPKWAQALIVDANCKRQRAEREAMTLRQAHGILNGRDWFCLNGADSARGEDVRRLWLLDRDQPHCICALGPDDTLLVGRGAKEAGDGKA